MKTRHEMIYEFMVALASNPNVCKEASAIDMNLNKEVADRVAQLACAFADTYINGA